MVQSLTGKNDDIQSGQILLEPESLSDLTFYPITLDRQSKIFLRKD